MDNTTTRWLLLIIGLLTSGATARMRIWRALKAIARATLAGLNPAEAVLSPGERPTARQMSVVLDSLHAHFSCKPQPSLAKS